MFVNMADLLFVLSVIVLILGTRGTAINAGSISYYLAKDKNRPAI